MKRLPSTLLLSLVAALMPPLSLVPSTDLAATAGQGGDHEKITTFYRLLVGRPDPTPGAGSVIVVPGTVVVPGSSAAAANDDALRVIDQLLDAYRLSVIEPAQTAVHAHMPGDAAKDVPSVAGGPRIQSTLVAFDAKSATYRITLTEGDKLLAEPVVRINRGGRAIVGSRNGEAAPYLFLLVEPFPPIPSGARSTGATGEVTQPVVVKRVNPVYPEEARKARLEGVVLLRARVGTDGHTKDVKVLRHEPMGLSEAAVAAVQQWEWKPAQNAKGDPVEVEWTMTIRFALR